MQDPSQDMRAVFYALCKSIDTPKSLAAWLAFKYNSVDLLSLSCRPGDYTCADSFSVDYLVVSFLSKWKGHNFGIDTKKVALDGFATAEQICTETNRRFRNNSFPTLPALGAEAVIHTAKRKIAAVLGPFDIVKVNRMCTWGPGATNGLSRRRCSVDIKHSEVPMTVTAGAYGIVKAHIESDPHWFAAITGVMPDGPYCVLPCCFRLVEGNKVVVVDKNAKTGRTIAAEPTGNSFLQQGVGRFIRRRLRSVGIDLDDQEINQCWASQAHVLDLATLDMRMASDTVAREVVYCLLPLDWFIYLDRLRSPVGLMPDGQTVRYEKFSSMGNAFTFELETLLFWALATSVTDLTGQRGIVSAYGDDLICPQGVSDQVVAVLEMFGFVINREKSFTSGRFYESCGRHYFDGTDVTPVFQKKPLRPPEYFEVEKRHVNRKVIKERRQSTAEFIRCGNRLKRWAIRSGYGLCLDPRIRNAWLTLRRLAGECDPKTFSYWIPQGTSGDDGWLLSSVEMPSIAMQYSASHGARCKVLRAVPGKVPAREQAMYALHMRRHREVSVPPSVEVARAVLQSRMRREVLAGPDTWGSAAYAANLLVDLFGEDTEAFTGFVSPRSEAVKFAAGKRWIIPTGHFELTW